MIPSSAEYALEIEHRKLECTARRQSSAELGIIDIVQFMESVAAARYPARVQFFEMVQVAASDALGHYFERLALVGSTALRIDMPDSDLDAVAFTKVEPWACGPQPQPIDALRLIADVLCEYDSSLQLQLVGSTRVPVLTVSTGDG